MGRRRIWHLTQSGILALNLFSIYSLLYTPSPHFHRIITVQYTPFSPPPPIQNCEPEPQSLEQSFGLVCPPAPSPSRISCCIPDVHSFHSISEWFTPD
ncbi:hypothetical protein T01_10198 [Trichinella spiralis]|uniref:Uncharacterized protein n=1 Tax=Trichinella spiralis TaxID=6334 RepID=A0A0V1BFV0_TRISP|nr:hypothetical protein T01_10198 [Trichinella spiralis]